MSEREKFEAWFTEDCKTEYLLDGRKATSLRAWQAAKADSAAEIAALKATIEALQMQVSPEMVDHYQALQEEAAALRTELEEARKPAKFYSCCKQHMGLPFTLTMKYQSQAHTVTVCPYCEKLAEAVAAIDAAKEQGK